jgi:iron complex outermembrane receptor protein
MWIHNRRGPGLIVAAVVATLGLEAAAQDQPSGGGLTEVVVTALRREQTQVETPARVSVLDSSLLERANVTRATDVVALIPNAALIKSNTEGEAFLVLRGMAPARNAETSTAIVVDGVLSGGPNELSQDFFDIEQIEVLKGPQGALYGRNAVGGAVIITTKKPTNEFEGSVKVGGGEANRVLGQVAVSGPIAADKLYGRFAFQHNERDGKLQNIFTGEYRDRYQRQTLRGELLWDATPDLSVSLRGGTSRQRDSGGIAFTAMILPDILDVNNLFLPFENDTESFNDQDRDNVSLKVDWNLFGGTLTSVSAYSFVEDTYGQDNFPYIFPDFGFDEEGNFRGGLTQWVLFNTKVKSQELRYTSDGTKRFRYIFGAYYADIEADRVTNLAQDLATLVLNGRRPNGPETLNPTIVFRDDETRRENFAWFAHVAFDLLDNLEVAAAVRYDDEDAEVEDLAPPEWTTTPGLVRSDNYSKAQPKFTVNWQFIPGSSLYATYGEAFKAGGFNPFGTAAAVQATNPLSTVRDEYGEETSESAEIGYKGQFLDGRLRLDAAIFQTDAENFQVFEFFPGPSLQAIAQVEEVEIEGFEVEATFRIIDGLTVGAGYGQTESKVKTLASNPSLVGNRMPYTPEDTLNVSADWRVPFGNDFEFGARADFTRIGKTYWDLLNTPGSVRDPVELLKAKVSLSKDNWEFSLWGENLLDEQYYAETVVIFPGPAVDPIFPIAAAASFEAPPRFWGADFKYRF